MIKAKDEYCFECEQYHPRWLSGCQNKPQIIVKKNTEAKEPIQGVKANTRKKRKQFLSEYQNH